MLLGVPPNPLGAGPGGAAQVGVLSGGSIDGGRESSRLRYVTGSDYIHVSDWVTAKPAGPSSPGLVLEEGYVFVPLNSTR